MTVPILTLPVTDWYCPKGCGQTDQTQEPRPHVRYHTCPRSRGLSAPMVPVGVKAKVEIHEREDYVGTEDVFLHDGRPVMNIVTTRDEGQDCMVFAPTAHATVRG